MTELEKYWLLDFSWPLLVVFLKSKLTASVFELIRTTNRTVKRTMATITADGIVKHH